MCGLITFDVHVPSYRGGTTPPDDREAARGTARRALGTGAPSTLVLAVAAGRLTTAPGASETGGPPK
ncbi:hypothetical protein GCM10009548_25370 [Streptomyces malaysiensis subsp. malaysiensis]